MTASSGGELLMDCLLALGASSGYGVPGESYLPILDAMVDRQQRFRFTVCRQEGGAAFMAEAEAKLTGRPGLCFVTRGPGATNAAIGVHTARQNGTPLLLFIGQVGRDMLGREAFQEIDYRAHFSSIAKWVVQIEQVERIPECVSRAWSTACSGRPGPVVIALPEDVLSERTHAPICRPVQPVDPAPDAGAVDDVLRLLDQARRPLAIVGGFGWTSTTRDSLAKLADRHALPLVADFRHQDLVDHHGPHYVGDAGVGMSVAVQALLRESDLLLVLGASLGEMTTAGYQLLEVPDPAQTLIHVHRSWTELGKVYNPSRAIVSGVQPFLDAMLSRDVSTGRKDWLAAARSGYIDHLEQARNEGPIDLGAITRVVERHLPGNAIITNGAGNFAVWPNRFLRLRREQRLLAPQSGAMGYGLPAAIAACLADPARTVVCFAGDGDFQMSCQELGTALQTGARPIVLLFNNASYGTIRMHQERAYPGRVSGTDLCNPDFLRLAEAYGLHAERVHRTEQFEAAFKRALVSPTGALLDLCLSEDRSNRVGPRQISENKDYLALGTD